MKYIKPVLTLLGPGWCISASVKSGQLLYFPSHDLFASFQKHLFRKIYSSVFSSEETPLKYLWLNIQLFLVSRLIKFHYFRRKERNSQCPKLPMHATTETIFWSGGSLEVMNPSELGQLHMRISQSVWAVLLPKSCLCYSSQACDQKSKNYFRFRSVPCWRDHKGLRKSADGRRFFQQLL